MLAEGGQIAFMLHEGFYYAAVAAHEVGRAHVLINTLADGCNSVHVGRYFLTLLVGEARPCEGIKHSGNAGINLLALGVHPVPLARDQISVAEAAFGLQVVNQV